MQGACWIRTLVAATVLLGALGASAEELPAADPGETPPGPVEGEPPPEKAVPEAKEVRKLREQLTEREDETRLEKPFSVEVLGRSLTIAGQYEVILDTINHIPLGLVPDHYGRELLEQEVEVEVFYSFGKPLSFFLQARAVYEEDLTSDYPDGKSDFYGQRGEMWIHSEEIAGSPFSVEIGRLDFEDDRLWWWDETLDSFRVTFELDPFEAWVAVGRELFTQSTKHSYVEPEQEEVIRLLAELSLDWNEDHAVQAFALFADDHSRTQRPGEVVLLDREDESDAELFWLGVRATGAMEVGKAGSFAYWADLGGVYGRERLHLSEPISREEAEIEEVLSLDVRGWGFDAGVTWAAELPLDPRVTVGYAWGSGDRRPDRNDRSYRQSGLHANEPGFGGMQRFKGYGRLLEPELSNLAVFTAGIGCSPFKRTSVDLVFHDYRQVERATELRNTRLDAELTGKHREIGQGFDLVVAVEEWERLEVEAAVSFLRAGDAFGGDEGRWVFAAFVGVRFAF